MRRSPGAGRLRGGPAQAARCTDATARVPDSIQRCASSWDSCCVCARLAVLGHVRAAAGNGRRTIPLESILVYPPYTRAIPHRSDHVASARTAYVRGTRELILGAVRLPRALACITPSPPAPGTHATGRNALRATPTPALAATPQDTHRDTEKSECKATPCIKVRPVRKESSVFRFNRQPAARRSRFSINRKLLSNFPMVASRARDATEFR